MAKNFKSWMIFISVIIYLLEYNFANSQEHLKYCTSQLVSSRHTKIFCSNITDGESVLRSIKTQYQYLYDKVDVTIKDSNITLLKYSTLSNLNDYRFRIAYDFQNNTINNLNMRSSIADVKFENNTIMNLTSISTDRVLLFFRTFRIDLSNNIIKYISPDFIDKLSEVTMSIKMMNCGLTEVPLGLFTSSQYITMVLLSYNKFRVIRENTFRNVEKRRSSEFIEIYPEKMHLSLDHCSIETIEDGAFQKMSIRKLNISYNEIKTLNENIFVDCSVYDIDLQHNQIENLKLDIFANIKDTLESVNLGSNKISILPRGMFQSNIQLKYLDLTDNPIKTIEGNAFLGLKKIKIMSFLSLEMFVGLKIPSIEMKQIIANNFNGLEAVVNLDLSNRSIEVVIPNAFSGLLSVEYLNLSYNNIEQIEPETFLDLNSIKSLDLSHNNIYELDSNSFVGLEKTTRLLVLKLSYNQMETFPAGIFGSTPKLSELIIDHNNISYLDNGIFSGLKYMSTLDLSYNELTDLYKEVLYPMISLKYLNIEANKITQMDFRNILDHLKNFRYFNLNNNPWTCSFLKNMIRDLLDRDIDFLSTATEHYTVHNVHGIACSEIEDFPHDNDTDESDMSLQLSDLLDGQYELLKEQMYQNTLLLTLNWIIALGFILMAILYIFFNRHQLFNSSSNQSLSRRSDHGSQVELINIK